MAEKLAPVESLLVSASGREAGKWKSITFAMIAVYLLLTAVWQFSHEGVTQRALLNLFLGCCSVVVIKYEKLIYVSPLGFVKETHTWVSHHRELLPWNEVKYVTLTTRGSRLMALIEKDEIGWKLFFKKDDLPELKEILKKHAPKVPVNDISPRF